GGMGDGYSSNGGDGGGIMGGYRRRSFNWHGGDNGVKSGDGLYGSYERDINFKGIKNNLFTKPDDLGVVAEGDSIAGGGRVEFHNGKATGFELSSPMDVKESGLNSRIDSLDTYTDKDGDRTVTVVAGQPVTVTEPELAPRTRRSFGLDIQLGTSTRPELALPSQPRSDVSGITELPGITSQSGSAESHVLWRGTKTDTSLEYPSNWSASEAFLKKSNDELVDMGYHYIPEKAKPPIPALGKVEEGSRQGDVSKGAKETSSEEVTTIDLSFATSSTDTEKYIADFLKSADKTKSLPKKGQSTDYVSLVPAEGPGDKKESGRVPIVSKIPQVGLTIIDCDLQDHGGLAGKEENGRGKVPLLGDLPIVGRLFSNATGKRPLTEEEKGRIVAYLEDRKSQPEGKPVEWDYETIKLKYADPREVQDSIEAGFMEGDPAKVAIEALQQSQQIILFGRKEQREKVRNMVQEIDRQAGQSAVDRTSIRTGEDEPDLPPASRFKLVPVNPWVMAGRDPLSTFALDVDTASYTLCRRYIRGGFLPPAGAVRMEEFVNNFNYQYPQRTNPTFKVHAEAAPSPFARKDQNLTLLKIGVKARTIGRDQRKAAHLIFVVDASASMGQPDRLPLVQQALGLLVNKLSAVDRVTLITCANEARLHMESIPARERDRIHQAINAIQPAGSTNLLAGLKLGYATARRSFAPKQINHVVLCSDGVANIGQTEAEAVLDEIAADRKQGITITCVGVGYGSYNDAFMEALANRGDGSYMFLDSARQAQRVFVEQLAATLQTVARDARIQVDFNPHRVRRYRLIGYENRDIEDKRFRDDTIDAGEVGSGQCSTALYELELIGQPSADKQGDLGTVFVRYCNVETGQIEEVSNRLSSAIVRRRTVAAAPRFFLAAGAARFAEMLRQSEHAQHGNMMDVLRVVEQVSLALPLDRDVRELAELVRKAEGLPRSP
ncbi:MAG: von Willebrand factor type A domain-containing protein, partial [Sedimentisphaerales bacterium]